MSNVAAARVPGPTLVAFVILAAAITWRPQLIAIGPLTPRMAEDLGVSFGAMGLITTASIVLMGLAAPLGPRLLDALGFRLSVAACMSALFGVAVARAVSPDYVLVLLWSGILGMLVGIGQSITPALGRELALAPRPSSATFTTGVVGSSVVAAAIVVPLAVLTGSWRGSLILLTIPVLVSIVVWLWLVPGRATRSGQKREPVRLPFRDREALWLALCFGLQGVLYHSLVTWLPEMAVEAGASEVRGGSIIAILNLAALAAGLVILFFGGRLGSTSTQVVAVAVSASLGAIALALGAPFELVALIVGLSAGAILPLLVTLGLTRSADPAHATSLLALVFMVGYVMAGLAPTVVGMLRDLSGDFSSATWLLALDSMLLVVVAVRVRRPDQHPRPPSPQPADRLPATG